MLISQDQGDVSARAQHYKNVFSGRLMNTGAELAFLCKQQLKTFNKG